MTKYICEISVYSWFYYKEICYYARSHERKKRNLFAYQLLRQTMMEFTNFRPSHRSKSSATRDEKISKVR